MRMETALAKASLTRVERRDPYKTKHIMKVAELNSLAPNFDWSAYFAASQVPPFDNLNVAEPDFFKELNSQLASTSLPDWKSYLRYHLANSRAPYLSSAFVNENFDFYRKYLRGAKELQPRWKRCVQYVDDQLGEALGQEYVRKTFPPELKAATLEMTRQIEDAMALRIQQLDWMSPQTKQQALNKLHAIRNKIGYPDKWRDYSSVTITRDDFYGNSKRADGVREPSRVQQDRQAGGPHRVGHDAAHGERLLQPADERHQLPCRRFAAAALRRQDGRCAQLRQHRLDHRPRADARLR